MKKRVAQIITLATSIIVMSGCSTPNPGTTPSSTSSSSASEIKLGAVYPLTGPNAKTGKEFMDAIELAIDIVNNKHEELGDFPFAKSEGIQSMGGAKFKLIKADSQGTPEVGATETERLITSEKLDAVLGCYQSAVTKTASTVAERLQVPFINSSSTATSLTERGLKWFFRTGPTDATFVADTVKFMDQYKDKVGIKNVAIVSEDTEFGMLFASLFKTAAENGGYTVVENISYPSNTPNVSSEVIRLKDAKPDVVVQLSYVSDAMLFMKTYKDMNFNPKMIIGQRAGFTTPEFVTSLGKDAEYMITTSAFSLDLANNRPYLKKINELFKAKSGVDLTTEYARVMQTVFIVADAYQRAGTTDKEAFRKAMSETNLNDSWMLTPYNGVQFDEKGQNKLAAGLMIQLKDGIYKTIYPANLKVMDPIIPVPEWSQR